MPPSGPSASPRGLSNPLITTVCAKAARAANAQTTTTTHTMCLSIRMLPFLHSAHSSGAEPDFAPFQYSDVPPFSDDVSAPFLNSTAPGPGPRKAVVVEEATLNYAAEEI